MASRAIVRRKSIISDYLNVYARSIQSFQSIGNSSQTVHSHAYHSGVNRPPVETKRVTEHKSFTRRDGLLLLSRNGYFNRSFHGFHSSGIGYGTSEVGPSLGMRYVSLSIRNATTVAAKQPEEEDKKVDELAKNRKEASPEECDQAVESLSSVKAKAKAKRLQESKKVARSIVQRAWAIVLKIGPALRAVASMSRFSSLLTFCVLNRLALCLGFVVY